MINFSNTEPPKALMVNGGSYIIETDYRAWLEVLKGFTNAETQDDYMAIISLVFKDDIEEPVQDIINAMDGFLQGYPRVDNGYAGGQQQEETFDFETDINWIIIAIRNQSGIDLSYRCKYFHWWEFLLEFNSLCGDSYFGILQQIRAYEGEDRKMQESKRQCALPIRYSKEQLREKDRLDDLFFDT